MKKFAAISILQQKKCFYDNMLQRKEEVCV